MIYGCSKHYWVLVCRGSLADQSCDLIAEQNTVLMSTLLPGICLFYFTLVSGMWTTHNGEWPTVHQMLWKDNARSKLKNSGWANLPLNHMVVHCVGSNYKAEYRCPAFVFWGARFYAGTEINDGKKNNESSFTCFNRISNNSTTRISNQTRQNMTGCVALLPSRFKIHHEIIVKSGVRSSRLIEHDIWYYYSLLILPCY